MPHTTRKRYAVVSCHVERPLDDDVWARFSTCQARRPGGFRIAALMRPPDPSFGEDESEWVARAQEAASRAPLGHHTHWTAPDHARPTGAPTGERVQAEGERMRQQGLAPTAFCGGGWYTDVEVAETCAALGYVDCTPRPARPSYLGPGEAWASLGAPARIRLPSGGLLTAVPTTHSLGDLARAFLGRRSLPPVVHVYVHDTDLAGLRRRTMLHAVLAVLARVAEPTDLDRLTAELGDAPEREWVSIAKTTE